MSIQRNSSGESIEHIERYDEVPQETVKSRDTEMRSGAPRVEVAAPSARYSNISRPDDAPAAYPPPTRTTYGQDSRQQPQGQSMGGPPGPPVGGPPAGGGKDPRGDNYRQEAFDFSMEPGGAVMHAIINIDDRDEFNINEGVNANFFNVFAEPGPELHSVACVWTNSFRIFEIVRIYNYKILTLIFGFFIAIVTGLMFGWLAFAQIWLLRPSLVMMRIVLRPLIQMWPVFVIYVVRPMFYAVGAFFSTIRIHTTNGEAIQEQWMPVEKV